MFWRMVRGALFRQRGKMVMVAFTIALGSSLATAMLNVMFDVGDKVNQELKTYGANINIMPRGASLLDDLYGASEGSGVSDKYLYEAELGKIKTIFWAFNIVDFSPYLYTRAALLKGAGPALAEGEVRLTGTWFSRRLDLPTGETLLTGMKPLKSWWDVSGRWITDEDTDAVMAGREAARRYGISLGDTVSLRIAGPGREEGIRNFTVKGIFHAGGDEDEYIYAPLLSVQELAGKPGLVNRVELSALTTPDNELSRRAAQDPKSLSIKDWETWYCTAYVSAICYQIDEVLTDSVSKPIRQVAESEGAILEKTQLLMFLITVLSLAGSALGISNLVTADVMERASEIGLLKAVGACDGPVSRLVLTEVLITGIAGGAIGYFAGLGFAQIIGHTVFSSAIAIKPAVIPLVAVLVFLVTMAGSIPSIKLLLSLRPAEVLHGR
ncbi:MAG: ABC transporter permease [Treponema sp.]|jgi:putative ABC transport system permease protein|nr:ABC transporter permease [Treponema sp.]